MDIGLEVLHVCVQYTLYTVYITNAKAFLKQYGFCKRAQYKFVLNTQTKCLDADDSVL